MNKNIVILSGLPIHQKRGASYSRIYEYAKALAANPDNLVYLCSTLLQDEFETLKEDSSLPQIKLKGTTKVAKEASFKKNWKKIFGLSETKKYISQFHDFIEKLDGETAVFIYPSFNNFREELAIINSLREKNVKIFTEQNELKLGIALNKAFPKNIFKKIFYSFFYPFIVWDAYLQDQLFKKYDGAIAISTNMYERIKKEKQAVIRIPILVDIERFKDLEKVVQKENINIGYTGSLTFKKDGLGELIRSVYILRKEYNIQNVKLNLYGEGYRDTILKLQKLIREMQLEKNVFIYGNVLSSEIPQILRKQQLLVLARPKNLQTEYGFSTKLAEYMASGVPALTTPVSDNSLYIKDGVNGFLVENNKAEIIAAKLSNIILKKEYLIQGIPLNAIITVQENFNSINYTQKITDFLFN